MATVIPNKFTSYELTDQEQRAGFLFTQDTVMVLRNELALAAESKLNITFDPTNPLIFAQQEAYIKGKLDFIDWLLVMNLQAIADNLTEAKQY